MDNLLEITKRKPRENSPKNHRKKNKANETSQIRQQELYDLVAAKRIDVTWQLQDMVGVALKWGKNLDRIQINLIDFPENFPEYKNSN
jgi:hypothetical protein